MNYLTKTTVWNAEVGLQRTLVIMNPNNDDGVEETIVTGLRGEGKRDFCFIYEIELVHGGRTF